MMLINETIIAVNESIWFLLNTCLIVGVALICTYAIMESNDRKKKNDEEAKNMLLSNNMEDDDYYILHVTRE